MEGLPSASGDTERLRRAASQLELHAIYYRHQEVADAVEVVKLIDDDSVVYLEGIRFSPVGEALLSDDVESIGKYRRTFGKDVTYFQMKQECLEYIDGYLASGNDNDEDFDPYTATKYRMLLEKDCEIIIADYRHCIDPARQEIIDKVTAKVRQSVGERQHDIFRAIETTGDVQTHVAKLERLITNEYEIHTMRERIATDTVIDDMASIIDDPSTLARMNHAESGKVKSYIIYGTAHARSLTHKMTKRGVEVVNHEPVPLRNSRYLDVDYRAHRRNYARTLALTALSGISWQLIADAESSQYDSTYHGTMDAIYEAFDNIKVKRKKSTSLVKRCVLLMQMLDDSPDESRRQYVEMLIENGL